MKSVGQRALKLLTVKDKVLKKKPATLAIIAEVCASASTRVPGGLGFLHSQSLRDGKFAVL